MAIVAGVASRRSVPASSGAAMTAHSEKCERYSVSVIPPLPISSMSGSFHAPGLADEASGAFWATSDLRLPQLSEMSPVVRHRLPTSAAQVHGSLTPHSQML